MKMIIAVIPPDRLEAVKNALAMVEVFRLTVMDVQGFGTIKPTDHKGREAEMTLTRRVQVMIGVNDEFLERTVDAIRSGARGDNSDPMRDGKIFILPLLDSIRIRTGEHGGEAI